MTTEAESDLNLALLGDEDVNSSRVPLTKRRLAATITALILGYIGSSLIAYKFKNEPPGPTWSQRDEVGADREYVPVGTETGKGSYEQVGYSVGISFNGKYLVSSSPDKDNQRGVVNLYVKLSGATEYSLADSVSGASAGCRFGASAAIDRDGMYVSVGAINENNMKGCVHTYEITSGNKLVDLGQILCGDNQYDQFGFSVSLAHWFHDGSDRVAMAIGAPASQSYGSGYVKMYEMNKYGYWKQSGETIRSYSGNAKFGWSVFVGNVGTKENGRDPMDMRCVIIGIPGRNEAVVNTWRNGAWTQLGPTFKFAEANADEGCGFSVAVDASASKAIMGCSNYRKVGYWVWQDTSVGWELMGEISGSKTGFGMSVSMDAPGVNIIVGSPYAGSSLNGEVKLYSYQPGGLQEEGSVSGVAANDQAGYSTAMSPGGKYAVCGCPYATVSGKRSAGMVTVLECVGTGCP